MPPTDVLSDRDHARLRALIEQRLGIRMPKGKKALLHGRLTRRARALHLPSVKDYVAHLFTLDEQSDELGHFLDVVTTNVSSFFREGQQLEQVREHLQGLCARLGAQDRELKIWSAACSRGQEVWTLAMMLAELPGQPRFSIVGSDVSTRVLHHAQRAVYEEAELSQVPKALSKRYFMRSKQRDSGQVRVVPELRQHARFLHLNLMDERFALPTDFDLVLLRNVLIYFDAETQRSVVSKVCRHLRDDGLLCVGLSESLHAHRLPLRHVQLGMYQRSAA